MINDLSRSATPLHVKEKLQTLPLGLKEAYRHLLVQLLKRLNPLSVYLARKVLALVSIACRTLNLKEVQYICALGSGSFSTNSTLDDHPVSY